jgi:hypothetical protein
MTEPSTAVVPDGGLYTPLALRGMVLLVRYLIRLFAIMLFAVSVASWLCLIVVWSSQNDPMNLTATAILAANTAVVIFAMCLLRVLY